MISKDGSVYYFSGGLGVSYGNENAVTINKPCHTHEFVEFVYTLKGKFTHFIDGEPYAVRHGDMVIINYNQRHEMKGDSDCKYINIFIKPAYINEAIINKYDVFSLLELSDFNEFSKIIDKSKKRITFEYEERERIEYIIRSVSTEPENKELGYETAMKALLNYLLILIFRKMSLKTVSFVNNIGDELLSYIRNHCHEKLTMSDVAKKCSYTPAYFSCKFKERAGMNFSDYLKLSRMKKAEQLLKFSDARISDIISQVGYSDSTKFYNDFKLYSGTTPLKFRKSKK